MSVTSLPATSLKRVMLITNKQRFHCERIINITVKEFSDDTKKYF
jgi:hypothetical protein